MFKEFVKTKKIYSKKMENDNLTLPKRWITINWIMHVET